MGQVDKIHDGDDHSFRPGDYLCSPSRLFFAALEPNGNFVIYQGEAPADAKKTQVWSSGSGTTDRILDGSLVLKLRAGPWDQNVKNLQIFADIGGHLRQLWASGGARDVTKETVAILGDDGQLSVWQREGRAWENGFSDPVTTFEVESIEYDTPRATIDAVTNAGLLRRRSITTATSKSQ